MWIADDLVKDKTFVDVGGLWDTKREKVTEAFLAGAKEVTMVDILPYKSYHWDNFDEKCEEKGVVCKNKISMDINEPSLLERVGTFDVVHCAGVLYHCPNPVYTLNQLYSITNDYLILGTTRIPSDSDDIRFPLGVPNGGVLLTDALTESQKEICINFYGLEGTKPYNFGDFWWYFFTDKYIELILKKCGFKILHKNYYWKVENSDCAVYYVTEKIK